MALIQLVTRVCSVDNDEDHIEVCNDGDRPVVTFRLLRGDSPSELVREVLMTPEAAHAVATALMKTADAVRC